MVPDYYLAALFLANAVPWSISRALVIRGVVDTHILPSVSQSSTVFGPTSEAFRPRVRSVLCS